MRGPTLLATATVTREAIAAWATVQCDVVLTVAQATVALDVAAFAPWLANDRKTRCEVYLSGEKLTGLTGPVDVIETDQSPIQQATFSVVDARVAYDHASSIAYGAPLVEVYQTARTSKGTAQKKLFTGNLEASSNEELYTPRGSMSAASLSKAWGDRGVNQGFLSLPAFAGYTWGEVIILYGASTCTPLTDFRGEFGDEVYSSFDISGLSLVDFIQKVAPLIGGYLRETDSTLELVPERFVVGPLASPAYAFTPANYLAVREDPPARPTTAITASAVLPDVDDLADQISELPETTVTVVREVTDAGVTNETTTTVSWGYGPSTYGGIAAVQTTLEVVRTDTEPYGRSTAWAFGVIREATTKAHYRAVTVTLASGRTVLAPTHQLLAVTSVVRAYYSPLVSVAYSPSEVYPDGSHHVIGTFMRQIEDTVTTYTYRQSATLGGECKLTTQQMTRRGLGSVLDPYGEQWDDGSYRSGLSGGTGEEYGLLEEQIEVWGDNGDDLNRAGPYSTAHTLEHKGWKSTGSALVSGEIRPEATYVVDHREATFRSVIDANRYDEMTVNGGITKRGPVYGTIPEVPTADPSAPAAMTRPWVITGASMRNIYPFSRQSVSLPDAQRPAEMYRAIRRWLRDALAVIRVIVHPIVPGLRVFDAATLTEPGRSLAAKQGYIKSIRRSFDPATGWQGQETTMAFTPPELDPTWP